MTTRNHPAPVMPRPCPETGWRFEPNWMPSLFTQDRMRWVGRCGAYDLWYDRMSDLFSVVDRDGEYTDFAENPDTGNLWIDDMAGDDYGVRPELPDMCLIYAAVAEYSRPPRMGYE
jgi:hypothetical protein